MSSAATTSSAKFEVIVLMLSGLVDVKSASPHGGMLIDIGTVLPSPLIKIAIDQDRLRSGLIPKELQ